MSKWSRDVEMVERPGGVLLTLHASHPDRITENLFRPGTEEIADSLGAFLRTRSDITALVVVHSDSAWSPAGSRTRMFQDRQIRRSNEQRGEAWVNQLIRAGADRKQVQIHLAGDSEPLFSNLTRLGQQLNRRVEIAVRVDQRRVR
jgi:outer membrane protein OmpA-like peptidoglycan-associated protein